jgi:probable rRNA maturation factor
LLPGFSVAAAFVVPDQAMKRCSPVKISWSFQISLRFSEMPAARVISKVHFHFLEGRISLSRRSELKLFIASIFKKERQKLAGIRYIFCSDHYLLQVNREFLDHDYYTDIITFDLSEPRQPINAEVYISVDRIRDNAKQFTSSLQNELHRVIFHGALHLCGYRDKTREEKAQMREMEDKYLKLYLGDRHYPKPGGQNPGQK